MVGSGSTEHPRPTTLDQQRHPHILHPWRSGTLIPARPHIISCHTLPWQPLLTFQDLEEGGIADRPGDWVDVFHTVFGVAGLSLLGYPGLQDVDPLFCMPASVIRKMGIGKAYTALPRMERWGDA